MKVFWGRASEGLLVLLGVSALAWALAAFAPGDAAEVLARRLSGGMPTTPEQVAHLRAEMGLDGPAPLRYLRWLGQAATGDFGSSWSTGRPVAAEIADALPHTLLLTAASLVLLLGIGLPLGLWAAARHDRWPDFAVRIAALAGAALPSYWLALLLMLLFSVQLQWLPSGGGGSAAHLVLPALTLALAGAGAYARLMRAAVLEHRSADHVRAARARGVGRHRLFVRHVLRHALLPVLTQCGLSVGALLGGSVIVETIFAWPGIGLLAVDAAQAHDLPMLQGVVMVAASAYVVAHGLVDALARGLDPRIGQRRGAAA